MQQNSAGDGTEACHARSLIDVDECPEHSNSGPSSRRQAPVESESSPEVSDMAPDATGGTLSEECTCVQESGGAGTRSCASARLARWPRGGQRVQRQKRAAAGAVVRTGDRKFDVARRKVGKVAPEAMSCENPRSTTMLPHRASDIPQVGEVAYAPSSRRRRNRLCLGRVLNILLCPGNSASPRFAASCCRDRSLAVIQPIWVQQTSEVPPMSEGLAATHTCAHPTSNVGTSLGRNCSTAHPSQTSPYGSVHPHLAGDVHSPVRASGVEKEGSRPTACATAPMLVSCDRSFRDWSVHQDKGPRGHEPNSSQWSQHRSGRRFQNSACGSVTHSPAPTPKKAGNTPATCRGIVDSVCRSSCSQSHDWKICA